MDMQLPDTVEDLAQADESVAQAPHATAYLLEYETGRFLAFPPHTGMELVEQPRVVYVPGMPPFCLGLMKWQGRQIPVLDLARLLLGRDSEPGLTTTGHVLVLAYQKAPGHALEYGAVNAPFLISMVSVEDSQQTDPSTEIKVLTGMSLSCFEYQGQAVPILDTARIFSKP
jgi:chemotaxis signal transduction protein